MGRLGSITWKLLLGWVISNNALLFGRGLVRVDINLQDVDIDQCSTDGWFAGTHGCNATSMEVSVANMQSRKTTAVILLS